MVSKCTGTSGQSLCHSANRVLRSTQPSPHGRPLHLDPFFAGPNHGVPNATANCIGSQISKGFQWILQGPGRIACIQGDPNKIGAGSFYQFLQFATVQITRMVFNGQTNPKIQSRGRILFRATSVLSTCLSMPPGPFRSFIGTQITTSDFRSDSMSDLE